MTATAFFYVIAALTGGSIILGLGVVLTALWAGDELPLDFSTARRHPGARIRDEDLP